MPKDKLGSDKVLRSTEVPRASADEYIRLSRVIRYLINESKWMGDMKRKRTFSIAGHDQESPILEVERAAAEGQITLWGQKKSGGSPEAIHATYWKVAMINRINIWTFPETVSRDHLDVPI